MTNKLLARLIRKEIEPLRKLDDLLYHNKKRFSDWNIIRNVGNAFLDIADELENEECQEEK